MSNERISGSSVLFFSQKIEQQQQNIEKTNSVRLTYCDARFLCEEKLAKRQGQIIQTQQALSTETDPVIRMHLGNKLDDFINDVQRLKKVLQGSSYVANLADLHNSQQIFHRAKAVHEKQCMANHECQSSNSTASLIQPLVR